MKITWVQSLVQAKRIKSTSKTKFDQNRTRKAKNQQFFTHGRAKILDFRAAVSAQLFPPFPLFSTASISDQRTTHAKRFQADLKPGSINLVPAHVKFKSIAGCFRALSHYAREMVIATSYFSRKSASDFQICTARKGVRLEYSMVD